MYGVFKQSDGSHKNNSRLRSTFLSTYKKVESGYNPLYYNYLGYYFYTLLGKCYLSLQNYIFYHFPHSRTFHIFLPTNIIKAKKIICHILCYNPMQQTNYFLLSSILPTSNKISIDFGGTLPSPSGPIFSIKLPPLLLISLILL